MKNLCKLDEHGRIEILDNDILDAVAAGTGGASMMLPVNDGCANKNDCTGAINNGGCTNSGKCFY